MYIMILNTVGTALLYVDCTLFHIERRKKLPFPLPEWKVCDIRNFPFSFGIAVTAFIHFPKLDVKRSPFKRSTVRSEGK